MEKLAISLIIISISIFFKTPVYIALALSLAYIYISALLGGARPRDLNRAIVYGALSAKNVLIILSLIGVLTSVWIKSGTIPYLMYIGLNVLKNYNFILASFLIMTIISMSLGSSMGSLSTMGVVLMAIGRSLGIDTTILAGAIISGSYIGDRSSPISSAFNLVTEMTDTDPVLNIKSMNSSLIPAFLISCAAFYALGLSQIPRDYDKIKDSLDFLSANFSLGLFCIIPVILLFALIFLRLKTSTALACSIASAFIVAMAFQHATPLELVKASLVGFSASGTSMTLAGGGFISMLKVLATIILATAYVGLLSRLELFENAIDMFSKTINTKYGLVVQSGMISFLINVITCNQTIGIIVPSQFLKNNYEKLRVRLECLVHAISDLGTFTVALIPWNINSILACSLLGISYGQLAPYALMCYILPAVFLIRYKLIPPK
ncbi:malate-2H(+)/Na(+)-lactate antiporter MleN [Peptoclostridium acidaminophilum DSM 3953]|uniref:Malate-2H(+)/Na(+)-lactate antiporter MleN n=1 Tax=Peptoclostridium acidaminophilum DSM 3953 TaxID=1286171 RepID=W8T0Z6_PEPAC|nr:Na+/H+ antiporter NhaC family protein [Peptoclostridium acidaminophilum]AHM55409.1 malate-2H(+)/Na(+)-lactate antiporter MleN [Peptoclostridium acidaminophilum DSM 3953]